MIINNNIFLYYISCSSHHHNNRRLGYYMSGSNLATNRRTFSNRQNRPNKLNDRPRVEAAEPKAWEKICLFVAVVLLGGKIAVYSQLEHTEPDVYTPCSTLCAGQTVSLVFLLTAMRKDVFNLELIKSIPRITWFWMTIGTLLFTVISPMLVFNAVKTVNVTRITIIQRSEVIFLLFLAKPLGIAEKWPSKWEIGNCFLIALGIVLTLLLSYEYFHPVSGGYLMHIVSNDELMIFISTLCDPLSIIINKRFVTKVPIGFFVCYRQILGTILYHGIALLRGAWMFFVLHRPLSQSYGLICCGLDHGKFLKILAG